MAVNPFWSDKVQGDAVLSASRPQNLPSPAVTEEGMPVMDDPERAPWKSGKGRGSGVLSGPTGGFVTPEVKRDVGSPEELQPGRRDGFQSQGLMSADTTNDEDGQGDKRTMGRFNMLRKVP